MGRARLQGLIEMDETYWVPEADLRGRQIQVIPGKQVADVAD